MAENKNAPGPQREAEGTKRAARPRPREEAHRPQGAEYGPEAIPHWVTEGPPPAPPPGEPGDYNRPLSCEAVEAFSGASGKARRESQQQPDAHPPPEWPALPQEALRGWLGDLARLACKDSEIGPAAVLLTGLVWAGIHFGAARYVIINETRHTPGCTAWLSAQVHGHAKEVARPLCGAC